MKVRARRLSLTTAGSVLAVAVVLAATASGCDHAAPSPTNTTVTGPSVSYGNLGDPVGIVNADPDEQAPILAAMRVSRNVELDGYRYYVGTIGGHPVVDVASGEGNEAAELATWILDKTFHPRATVFCGTAGAQNSAVNVGDVVLSGLVVDKSGINYALGGSQVPYKIEIHATKGTDVLGAIIGGYGNAYPDPSNAPGFSSHSDPTNKQWLFVDAWAATRQLVTAAKPAGASLGSTTVADATGKPTAQGSFANKIVVGTIGVANVWTEPLSWIEAQNMLYQTDAEDNEGSGFAFANASAGVPWMLVRGISDTPWYPNAGDSALATDHAATVVKYLIAHLPAKVDTAPVTISDLSALANARLAGYLVASQAYFSVTPVTKVVYTDANGKTVTLTGRSLVKIAREYTYRAAHP